MVSFIIGLVPGLGYLQEKNKASLIDKILQNTYNPFERFYSTPTLNVALSFCQSVTKSSLSITFNQLALCNIVLGIKESTLCHYLKKGHLSHRLIFCCLDIFLFSSIVTSDL